MLCLGSIYQDHLGPCVLYWEGCYKTMRTDIFLESSSGRRHGLDSGLWFSRMVYRTKLQSCLETGGHQGPRRRSNLACWP